MKTYRSEKNLIEAGKESVAMLVGQKRADLLWDYLEKK
jgi:hypothetical protein